MELLPSVSFHGDFVLTSIVVDGKAEWKSPFYAIGFDDNRVRAAFECGVRHACTLVESLSEKNNNSEVTNED